MPVSLKFNLVSGENTQVVDYLNKPESGAIKVADKPQDVMGYDVYHFAGSTFRISVFMDKASYVIYSDERIQAIYAISKLEKATGVKLEGVK